MNTALISRLLALVYLAAGASISRAQTTIASVHRYAFAANAGWLDWRPSVSAGVAMTETYLAGSAYGANIGWISFGDGSPSNGHTYSNASASDFGVNLTANGELSGHAWSANTGWIVFESSHGQPRLDYLTGKLSGQVWSPNLGWIALETAFSDLVSTLACPDVDADGVGDAYERRFFGHLDALTASADYDRDGISDAAEYLANSAPNDATSWLRILGQAHIPATAQSNLVFTAQPGRVYRVETCADLISPWVQAVPGPFLPSATPVATVNFTHAGGPARFFRLVAIKPLQP